jgi:hypothetical protein
MGSVDRSPAALFLQEREDDPLTFTAIEAERGG